MAGPRPLLIVDDDAALRQTLAEQLSLDGEFAPAEAETAKDAEQLLTGSCGVGRNIGSACCCVAHAGAAIPRASAGMRLGSTGA